MADEKVRFSVIGMNHDHIYGMVGTLIKAGAELVSFHAAEPESVEKFQKKYPDAKQAKSIDEVLEDRSVQLIASAAIPSERGALGIRVMQHGKDFFSDKPGVTTLKDLEEARRAQQQTHRIWCILYGERLETPVTIKAAELIKDGAIGKVVQTLGLGPHKAGIPSRQPWFFKRETNGGIINDIGCHQVDQFLLFTGSDTAEVVTAQVGNFKFPELPEFEDFGDAMLRSDKAIGYFRCDWLNPAGSTTWGDSRMMIIGTEGYMELRKTVDLAGRPGGNHLFLVDAKKTEYIDCSKVPVTYSKNLLNDILQRTETVMSQDDAFKICEISLKAQAAAKRLGNLK